MAKACVLLFFLLCYVAGITALKCNVCNSVSDETWIPCKEPSQYSSRDCTALFPRSKYCVIINGNHTTIRPTLARTTGTARESVVGPRRSCQFDLDKFELFEANLKPGCHKVNMTKTNYLAFDYFHFDGQVCLCDEDNCNSGEYGIQKGNNPGRPTGGYNAGAALAGSLLLAFTAAVLAL